MPSVSLPIVFFIEVIAFSLMFVIMSVATDSRAVGELAGIAIGSTVALNAFVVGRGVHEPAIGNFIGANILWMILLQFGAAAA